MPYNGSGIFQSLPPPQYPAVAGDVIRAAYFNAVINDLLAGLTNAITRDGQSPPTGNLPMAGKKHTGVADATAADQYASYGQQLAFEVKQLPSAADYGATGASTVTDTAALNAGIAAIHAGGGGMLRVNKFISTSIDLSTLTNQTDVMLVDERWKTAGHYALFGINGDAELRLHGASVNGGEGPSFVGVNNAASGDRTVSIVARYGSGAGATVNQYFHMGVWDGANWYPELDWIGKGSDGFRSRWRIGADGTAQINANKTGSAAYTASEIFAVNKPAQDGGGNLLLVKVGAVVVPQEVHIAAANSPLRFQTAAGVNKFSLLSEFPSAGQMCLFDHIAGVNKIVSTSGGSTAFTGGISFTVQTAASAANNTLFVDSADNKLKYKGLSGTLTVLANP